MSDIIVPQSDVKLCTRNVNLYYGENHALKDINLDIKTNKITAFIGPSGCGKSTYLKSLNRMNDMIPDCKITGRFLLDGEDIYADGVDTNVLRRRIGMVFQKPNPFPMSIYDNIAYGPRVHGIKSKAKLDRIVEESLIGAAVFDEVKDRLHKSALSLSGGQQQRICIARAIAVQPEVILMDEPTSALDPVSTLKIEELMNTLKEKYTGYIGYAIELGKATEAFPLKTERGIIGVLRCTGILIRSTVVVVNYTVTVEVYNIVVAR